MTMLQEMQTLAQSGNDEVVWSAVTAWATAKLIEWAKAKPWLPFVSVDGSTLNRITSWLIAFIVSAGFVFTFDGDNVMITFSVTTLVAAFGHAVRQVFFQEVAYMKLVKKDGAS